MGGVLVAAAGAGWAIAIDAVTFAVSAACLAMLRVPTRVAAQRSSFVADLREGWVAFRSRRWVWTFVVYFAIVNVLWGAWGVLGPIVAERDLGGAAAWGAILAAVGLGALAGSLLATRVKPRRPLLLAALADGLFALPLAFMAAATSVPLIACGAALSGAGMALAISVWESTLQRHVPAVKAPLAVPQSDSAHPSSITPKRSRRIPVTTAETSSEPPQPSLLEKKMNMTIGWSERERRSCHRRGAPTNGIPPRRLYRGRTRSRPDP